MRGAACRRVRRRAPRLEVGLGDGGVIDGELLQVEKVRRMDIDELVYYEVIRQKTASLIASCCECGAASAGADDETIEKMRVASNQTVDAPQRYR